MSKPNILFLMTDQQRWDAMACVGGWLETPNLDRIATEGIRFSNCVTNSPVCIPGRLSLATGHYPHNTGVWQNMHHTLSPETPTWMQAVRDAGYRTSLFGKTHLHPHEGDLRDREDLMHSYGLDDVNEIGGPIASQRVLSHMTAMWQEKGVWEAYQADFADRVASTARPSVLDLEDYTDVYVGQQAKAYLEGYDRPEPWFCWVSFGGPHSPFDTPEPYASRYAPEEMPDPVHPVEDDRERPRGCLDERRETGRVDFEPGGEKLIRANYAGNVTLIDHQIGEILQAIEARGEMDTTVVAFVSDHGEMYGDYGLTGKSNFLNGAVRVPLLVRTPEMVGSHVAGRVCASPVEWIDLGPTLVELAGGAMGHRQFGKSLCPVLADPDGEHRAEAISEHEGEVMLLNQEWKMAINQAGQPYLLFDVQNDPDEVHNLAGKPEMAYLEQNLEVRILERIVSAQVYDGVRFAQG